MSTIGLDVRGMELAIDAGARSRRVRRRRGSPDACLLQTPPLEHRHTVYATLKRAGEVTAALVLLVLTAPLIGLAALLVKLTSRGPAFYTQTRVGHQGRIFTIYKLRTMIHNCESLTGPRWAIPGDPRVTWVGHFLRASHLDELPQLLNVLRGDMSLIGPRPERPEFVRELERSVPGYGRRLSVRPGVTGLAQVQLPGDTDLDSVRRKVAHDVYYIRHMSFWLDFRIVACTVCRMLGIPFAVAGKVFRVPGDEAVQDAIRQRATQAAA